MNVAPDGRAAQFARAPAYGAGSHSHEILLGSLLESYSCRGRVAQLGEHLLCKHAFISPKSLNRRLLTVQTPLLVGLLIGLQIIEDTLSKTSGYSLIRREKCFIPRASR